MRGFLTVLGLTLFAPWSASPARAQCPEPVGLDILLSRSTAIDEAIAARRNSTARDESRRLRDEVRCISKPLPDVDVAAEIARAIGSGYVAGGERALGKPWLRTAQDLDPRFVWTLPPDHDVMKVLDELREEPPSEPVVSSDERFVAQAWLDGESIEIPKARPDRPHIFQIGENPTETSIVFGNRFPSEALQPPVADGRGGKRRRDPVEVATVQTVPGVPDEPFEATRLRPPEKTPLLVSGAALVVVAGGLYGLAAQRRQRFDDPAFATSLDELTQLRNQVNGLVIASAATFALGAAGTTWGSLVDARGTATLRVRF